MRRSGHRRRRWPRCGRRRYVGTNGTPVGKRWRDVDGLTLCYVCAGSVPGAIQTDAAPRSASPSLTGLASPTPPEEIDDDEDARS